MESATARPTFLQHYIDYLSSGAGLIAIFVLFAILLYAWTESQQPAETSETIPGCVRYGLYTRSNLDTQHELKVEEDQEPRVQALFAYPIKSCRGVELTAAEVTGLGLKHDRLFSFAQLVKKNGKSEVGEEYHWRFITQRERPQMALITTELWIPDPRLQTTPQEEKDQVNDWSTNGGCLTIRFPDAKSFFGLFHLYTRTITINVPLNPTSQRAQAKGYKSEPLSIWKDAPVSLNINTEIHPLAFSKLKNFLGISHPLALFRADQPRTITRSLPSDRPDETFSVGFGDAFPVSFMNLASVRSVDASLPETSKLRNHLDARRFRANVYLVGPSAFSEDSWKRVYIGVAQKKKKKKKKKTTLADNDEDDNAAPEVEAGEYHIACRTARCTLPNVDPSSGVRDKQEPFSTLKRTRVVDEGARPHSSLGMSVLPLFEKGFVRVGEWIEVREEGVHVYEKMFSSK